MNMPFSSRLSTVSTEHFRGVDLTSPPESVSPSRSPSAPNMMPGAGGKPEKRPGYSKIGDYGGKIYGMFRLNTVGGEHAVIHAGKKIFLDSPQAEVFSAAAEKPSVGVQYGEKLYLLDGEKLRVLGLSTAEEDGAQTVSATVSSAADFAYVPTVTISRAPSGGGVPFEDFNLLSSRFTEDFCGTEDAVSYQLSYSGLSAGAVTVKVLDKTSTLRKKVWNSLIYGVDFSVDRTAGKVNFITAPGVSPIEGEDNVSITAEVDIPGYGSRINRCRAAALYGVGGIGNRLFVTDNPDFPGIDWYSEMDDLCYFGESRFCALAPEGGRIVGYSVVDGLLAAHCAGGGEAPVFLRSGEISEGEAVFPVKNILHGPGAAAGRGFSVLGEEPLFLTEQGVFALTVKDTTGSRCLQRRSWFIDGALSAETGLENAVFCPWKSFALIFINGRVYLLDGGQKTYEQAAPYSTFQYECYYWENVPAACAAILGGRLCFGDAAGGVFAFGEPGALNAGAYSDCGKAINAHWELPDISGGSFYNKKSLRAVFAELAPQPITSVRVLVKHGGVWVPLWEEGAAFRYFRWSGIKWGEFVWQCDDKSRAFGRRRLIPGMQKIRVRFENSVSGEPFGLYSAAVEFTETGKKAF